jgi:hypothetical protein
MAEVKPRCSNRAAFLEGSPVDLRRNCLALQFAVHAGRGGWSERSLRRFCADRGISEDQRRRRWPKGVRSLGWQLTAVADRDMFVQFAGAETPGMLQIVATRFTRNRDLKPVVARLALSDLMHPLDTLRRTRRTAGRMWQCHGRPRATGRVGREVDCWLLVLAYSLCVVVWLLDRSHDDRSTLMVVRGSLHLIGLR